MEALALTFFPYPHFLDGQQREGLALPAAKACSRCDRQCARSFSTDLGLCSYGVNYTWFDRRLLVFGLVVSDFPGGSAARTKVVRQQRGATVRRSDVEAARDTYMGIVKAHEDEIEARKEAIIQEYRDRERYKEDFLSHLRPDIEKSFAYFHDYRQFIARMRQNINVILEQRYPGGDIGHKLAGALPSEKAIYYGSQLMEEKLRTAYFLLHPEDINDRQKYTIFRFHGLVTKYLRIYQSAFDEKGITVEVFGESVGEILGHPAAVSVIPHTFIDNALKYSPRNAVVKVQFSETGDSIGFKVSSYGPRIGAGEGERIFDIFYRGKDARAHDEEGAGFGLYLAQFIARQLDTAIVVSQSDEPQLGKSYWTSFSVGFKRER
jgi:signal transduction histidine kinase